jgi:hypothetical protein
MTAAYRVGGGEVGGSVAFYEPSNMSTVWGKADGRPVCRQWTRSFN